MYRNLNIRLLGIAGRQSEVIELALSHRFKGMDLDLAEFAGQVETSGLAHARRLIDSARIKLGSFRLPVQWSGAEDDPDAYARDLAKLPKAAELAAAIGCTRAVTGVAPASDERPYHENFEFHRKRLVEIADVLSGHGVKLGLEIVTSPMARAGRAFQFIADYDGLVQLVKLVSADNVGITLDTWDLLTSGGDLATIKKLPANKIVSVVLCDAATGADPATATEGQQLLPGEGGGGQIDCTAALVSLAEVGYDGPIAPKAGATALHGLSRDAKVKKAAELLAQLWKQAGLSADGKLSAATSK
jgi:sugar phosphate isomerase/epimerase